ncbi:MAG: hypothetical protein ABI207_06665 [Crocinitomicaceae bacterium]
MDFPQYRKLSNGKSWYKIENERNFIEIQMVGSKKFVHLIEAKQYPEMLRIMEMLDLSMPDISIVSEEEFNQIAQNN